MNAFDPLLQDLRFGLRSLAGSPGFTAVAVLTLALGIGANAAIFSLFDAVLLRPLTLDHPDRVVAVRDHFPEQDWDQISVPNFEDYRDGSGEIFSRFAALQGTDLYLEEGEGDRKLRGLYASADLLRMLAVEPRAGRFFNDSEDRELEHVAVLSHGFFERHFGGDETAVGKTLRLAYWSTGSRPGQPRGAHGEVFTIIGVLPPELELPPVMGRGALRFLDPEIVIPMGLWSWGVGHRDAYAFPVLAELAPGVGIDQARARVESIAARIARDHPETNGGYRASVEALPRLVAARYRPMLVVLGGAVALVLLLACVNVATLVLARSASRAAELAVRSALGAGRLRLARQLFTESALLALSGAGLGLGLGHLTHRLLVALMPFRVPRLDQVATDLRTVAFTLGVAVLAVLLFGTGPALAAGRGSLQAALGAGGRGAAGGSQRTLALLQGVEIALTAVLLVGAGLLLRSLVALTSVDLGIDSSRRLVAELELQPRELSKYGHQLQVSDLWQRTLERLRGVAGVEWAEAISEPSLRGPGEHWDVTLADPDRRGAVATTQWRFVTPGYLPRMGVELRAGRFFDEEDRERPVALVDEALARAFWPSGDAVGGEIYFGRQNLESGLLPEELDRLAFATWLRDLTAAERERMEAIRARLGDRIDRRYPTPYRMKVVGVVGAVKNLGPTGDPGPQAYVPFSSGRRATMVTGTGLEPRHLAAAVEAAIHEVDPSEPRIVSMRAMDDYVAATTAEPRYRTLLLSAFAGVALAIAMVGLHGVVAYSVSRRVRELGVRRALGAQSADIVRLVVGQGARITLLGLAPGLGLGLALSRYLESLLFGVGSADLATYGAVSILIVAVSALATWVPARRAVRVEPSEALRAE